MAYRILKAVQDTYITSKYIGGSRSLDSNTGLAGTLDLYKLWDETGQGGAPTGSLELSRALIRFDLGPLMEMTSSGRLTLPDSTFRCYLQLRDIYGGQQTPAGATLSLFPLAKSFEEGVGRDVVAYRDLDAANFLSASESTVWTISGAAQTGSLGDAQADYYISGNLGGGSGSLEVQQVFVSGDEDLFMDVTSLVSGTLKRQIPDNGWRLSFRWDQEQDEVTRWVKRFGTRHTQDRWFRPQVIAVWNDTVQDDNTGAWFDQGADIGLYTRRNGRPANLLSGSTQITGSNSLILDLVASRSVTTLTTSWSTSHSQSIQHTTSSIEFFTVYATGSQIRTGSYRAPVTVSLTPSLVTFLDGSTTIQFETSWRSLDRTVLYKRGLWVPWTKTDATEEVLPERRYVVNVTNLQGEYGPSDTVVLRVFVQDNAQTPQPLRIPKPSTSVTFKRMWWRVVESLTKKVMIPFHDPGTLVSTDGGGMTFTLWTQDLAPGFLYDIEFKVEDEAGQTIRLDARQGFRFKVVT